MDTIMLDAKKALLKKQACFAQLSSEEYDMLANILKEVSVKTGDVVVTEGDPVDSVYLIVDGKADVRHVYVKDGMIEFQSLATLTTPQAIGLNESGFYSLSGVRTATVVALTDMILLQLSVAAFHGFALAYPHVNEVMRKHARDILGMKSYSE